MIKLKNLNKYFNKGKQSQIHVIDNLDITLEENGLVVLLGPSGSGKTTLLNVIGGLDKVNSGSITFDEQTINRYSARKWDYIRNHHVGYIFQNYNLMTNSSVFDNISFVLKLLGITQEEEINKRIDYVLESVGMIKYKKRIVSKLSGGQQQRVAIARALVKNPKVIIADEPTGNLDSKNTHQVMGIIKNISKHTLVVLVTHENDIATFYGNRIININDGKIVSDEENNNSDFIIDDKEDNEIYLQDLNNETITPNSGLNLNLYSNKDLKEKNPIDITIIYENDQIYIKTEAKNNYRVKFIDETSDINIIDAKYEVLSKSNEVENDFDMREVADDSLIKSKRVSVISNKTALQIAFSNLMSSSIKGKFLYIIYAFCGIVVAYCAASFGDLYKVEDNEFVNVPKEYVHVISEDKRNEDAVVMSYDDLLDYKEEGLIDGFSFGADYLTIDTAVSNYNQTENSFYENTYGLYYESTNIGLVKNDELIYGVMPTSINEVVIDKILAKNIIDSASSTRMNDYRDLLHTSVNKNMLNSIGEYNQISFSIVGIVETEEPCVYGGDLFVETANSDSIIPIDLLSDSISVTYGKLPVAKDEIIVLFDDEYLSATGTFTDINVSGSVFSGILPESTKIVGLYTLDSEVTYFDVYSPNYSYLPLGTSETVLSNSTNYNTFSINVSYYHVYSYNNSAKFVAQQLNEDGYDAAVTYDEARADYIDNTRSAGSIRVLVAFLIILAVCFYFIIHSSLLSRVKEISVYRSLGVTKFDIIKLHLVEIIIITTFTTIVGYGIGLLLLNVLQNSLKDFVTLFTFNPIFIILGIVFIYIANMLGGLLPVSLLLRRTPAEISALYE